VLPFMHVIKAYIAFPFFCAFYDVMFAVIFLKHPYFNLNPRPKHLFAKHFVCLSFFAFGLVEHLVKNGRF
jgi:hypothetical protein